LKIDENKIHRRYIPPFGRESSEVGCCDPLKHKGQVAEKIFGPDYRTKYALF